jgi:hypothetical protein
MNLWDFIVANFATIMGIGGFLTGLGSLGRQFYLDKRAEKRANQKAPIEDTNMAISTSNSAATAIKSYSDEISDLRKEMGDMRKEHGIEMAEMQKQIDRLQHEIDAKDRIIDEWRIGIGHLVGQLKDRRITPVWQPAPASGIQNDRRKDW